MGPAFQVGNQNFLSNRQDGMGGHKILRIQFMGCTPGLNKIQRIRLGEEGCGNNNA
jgi:hypothetical protein